MTPHEITQAINHHESAGSSESERWLREIAYQLALMNEGHAVGIAARVESLENSRERLTQRWNRERKERLAHAEPGKKDSESTPANWRVGRQIPLNVYDGDRPVCQCHDLIDAADIVRAMNRKLAHAEPGKKDTEATPANIPIGWRCGSCNYGRDFSDGNLRARAKKDLEYGWCPACDNKGLQLVFERQFFTPDREPSNDPTGDILAGEIFRRQHEPKGPKA